jgi:hypothetical protein
LFHAVATNENEWLMALSTSISVQAQFTVATTIRRQNKLNKDSKATHSDESSFGLPPKTPVRPAVLRMAEAERSR